MAFFNTPIAALLLSLSIVLSPIVVNSSIASTPSTVPGTLSFPVEELAKDKQYLKSHMSATANKVEQFIANKIEQKLNDPTTIDSDKECFSTCKEVYEISVDKIKEGMEYISKGDFVSANSYVSSFMTYIDTCNECSNDFRKFNEWATSVASDFLKKTAKYNSIN